ncbi:energy transducer TonB [Lutibacter holmesii]|uniref:Energy transducer TonB n=1 Tax=Lutibacter holmesii TaxID=1137985 RepID=A0ABW3WRI7_9FLAO
MSHFLDTKYKKQSAAITTVIMSLLVLVLFFVGLNYMDPPEEYGIAVNFGTSNVGMGAIQPEAPLKAQSEEIVEEQEEVIEEVVEATEPEVSQEETVVSEDVATQETEESIAIKKALEEKKKADALAEKQRLEEERIEKERQEAIAKQKAEEAEKKKKLDALMGGINNTNGTATGGEGNDNEAGDKGKETGDPYAPSYFGNAGKGSRGVGYGLNGRGKPTGKIFKQECNEYGLVVIRIEVNKQGNVVKTSLDLKNTKNDAPCLVETAKKIAKTYEWEVDNDAPTRQFGFVYINFKQQ